MKPLTAAFALVLLAAAVLPAVRDDARGPAFTDENVSKPAEPAHRPLAPAPTATQARTEDRAHPSDPAPHVPPGFGAVGPPAPASPAPAPGAAPPAPPALPAPPAPPAAGPPAAPPPDLQVPSAPSPTPATPPRAQPPPSPAEPSPPPEERDPTLVDGATGGLLEVLGDVLGLA